MVGNGTINLTARRRHVRLPVMVEVRWRRHNSTDFAIAALSEISEGGALLLTREPPRADEEIIVEIMPPGASGRSRCSRSCATPTTPTASAWSSSLATWAACTGLREVIRRLVEQ